MKVLLVGRVHSVVAKGVEDVLAVAMEGEIQPREHYTQILIIIITPHV